MKHIQPLLVAAYVSLVLATACTKNDVCSNVKLVAEDPVAIQEIEDWVDYQRTHNMLGMDKAISSRMVRPGSYSIPVPLELKWAQGVEARVLTDPKGVIKGLFLGERDLQGLVVDFDAQEDFLLPPDKLRSITPRTSLICIRRD